MFTTTVAAALSAAGLALALQTAYRRRFRRATRIAALSLLPVGLAMAGLVKLGSKVGKAFGDWATDLVFKPTVWAGFGVLAVAVLLYVAQRLAGGDGRGKRKAAERGTATPAAEPASSRPALGSGRSAKRGGGEDFSDIEEILKKHGI